MRRLGVCLGSLSVVLLWGCGVHYGFTQGGVLPTHIKTIAILPFENQTASPDVGKEIYDQMRAELQKRLGLRDALRHSEQFSMGGSPGPGSSSH